MKTIEADVDQYLLNNYMGYKIEVSLPVRPTARMAQRLNTLDREAGWKSVYFQGNNATAPFAEQVETFCYIGKYMEFNPLPSILKVEDYFKKQNINLFLMSLCTAIMTFFSSIIFKWGIAITL